MKDQGNSKGEFTVVVILPSRMKVSYCTSKFFVSPELSSVRDYVITHSVRSMYVVCMYVYVCMYVVICRIDHCIHIH